jgi:hypothetical protein
MVDAGVQIPLDALEDGELFGSVAQLAERLIVSQRDVGSSPTRPSGGLRIEFTEGLADRRRRQPPAKRPTRKGLQVRPLFLPLDSDFGFRASDFLPLRSCSWESSRSPKPAEWVRILPALLGPVT